MKLAKIQANDTDFFSFFKVHQVATVPMLEVSVIKKFKPGGFQESIDIDIVEDTKEDLLSASILLDRSWLGDETHLNPFALDITKSFLNTFTPPPDQSKMHELAEKLFQLHGTRDEVISLTHAEKKSPPKSTAFKHLEACVMNKMQEVEIKLTTCNVSFKNLDLKAKQRFELGIIYF
jgi:hypothetical protein